jgi:hypothetical protein
LTRLLLAGIKAVGTDYLGIERDQPDHATHKVRDPVDPLSALPAGCVDSHSA